MDNYEYEEDIELDENEQDEIELIELHYMKLRGQTLRGSNGVTYDTLAGLKLAANQELKWEFKNRASKDKFASAAEYRKYLESTGELQYFTIQL